MCPRITTKDKVALYKSLQLCPYVRLFALGYIFVANLISMFPRWLSETHSFILLYVDAFKKTEAGFKRP